VQGKHLTVVRRQASETAGLRDERLGDGTTSKIAEDGGGARESLRWRSQIKSGTAEQSSLSSGPELSEQKSPRRVSSAAKTSGRTAAPFMRILVAHNRYRQSGGEDGVFESEVKLLAGAGHEVDTLVVSNDGVDSFFDKATTALRTVENPVGMAAMRDAIGRVRPDLVHVHNFFPLLSPGIYKICRQAGIPVVQTLHNYRPVCASAQLFRSGHVCQLCLDGSPIAGVLHRCYRGSLIGSAAVARMIAVHRRRNTWQNDVDRFIALTQFGRSIFVDAGFPADHIDVKPNFLEDPGEPSEVPRSGVLFVGRLAPEKGAKTLIEASARYNFPLRIVGDGPELARLKSLAGENVAFLGALSRQAVLDEMRRAAVIAIPSLWYEGFPLVVVEAFARATPVVASRLGALAEILEDGKTGLLASAGNPIELGECLMRMLRDPGLSRQFGRAARQIYLSRYTPAINLKMIEAIYQKTLSSRRDKQ
jgi:glycosyltransferase involved in cell wall biosynthesis